MDAFDDNDAEYWTHRRWASAAGDLRYWIRVAEQMMGQHGWPLKKVILLILYTCRSEGVFADAEDEAILECDLIAHFTERAMDDTPSALMLPEDWR